MKLKILLGIIIALFLVSLGLNFFIDDLIETTKTEEGLKGEVKDIPIILTPPESLTLLEATEQNANLSSNIKLAVEKIKDLKEDAILYGISVRLDKKLIKGQGSETYIFGSPQEQDYWWTVTISQSNNSITRAIIPKIDYMGNTLTYMQADYWKINYIQAFQTAEKKGGEEFRKTHPEATITLDLAQAPPKDWLWWTIKYRDENSNDQLKLRINANDGQVYSDKGEILQ